MTTLNKYGPVGGFGTDMDPNRGAFDNLKPVVKSGLDKIRAIGEYIKNNNVGSELKDRFTNVLQGYKSKLAGAANAGANALGSYGSQTLASSPLHKTAVSAIMKYKGRPASADTRDLKLIQQRGEEENRPDYTQQALTSF